MIQKAVREDVAVLRQLLDRVEALLGDGQAEQLPGLPLARTAIALDQAAAKLGRLVAELEHRELFPGNGNRAGPKKPRRGR